MPIVVIGFSFGLLIYWYFKRRLSEWVLLYSLVAYAGAIILKYAVQLSTIGAIESASGNNPVVLGFYYGIQTGVFEVGGAFLVASFAFSHGHFKARHAEGYGLSLAFWENGVLIGLLTLIDYVTYYSILSNPNSSLALTLYPTLVKDAPSLFYGNSHALPLIGYSILERITSLIGHFSWGYLAVLGAVYRKNIYFAVAFPIGFLIDFLVPFSSILGLGLFELVAFIVAIAGLVGALAITQGVRKQMTTESVAASQSAPNSNIHSFSYTNFRRAVNYGKIYLIVSLVIGIVISVLLNVESIFVSHSSTPGSAVALPVLAKIPALILPIFPVMGSFGSLMIFVSDKDKGVYEYLIAYGINPSKIFWSIVAATIGLVSIVLGVSVSIDVGLAAFAGTMSITFAELLIFYVIPISYSTAIFMTMAGMIWSSLAVRRTGINSPVGVISLIGLVPILAVLYTSLAVGPTYFILFISAVSLALIVAVGVLIGVSNSKLVRERFLSGA